MAGPVHRDENGNTTSVKDFVVFMFNDLIIRIKRKAVYCCDSDMDIGKTQFCFYMLKFSKNKEVNQKIEFIEKNLSMLLSFEEQDLKNDKENGERNIFLDIIQKVPREIIITGKKLFEVIHMVHSGIDQEVERVKQLKENFETGVDVNFNSQSVINRVGEDSQISKNIQENIYPCVRLGQVYTNSVLKVVPDFKTEVLLEKNISFFEFVNACRYFGCYNLPEDLNEDY
jgi:predicted nucleic acid-binding protein